MSEQARESIQGVDVALKIKEKKPGQRACDEKDAKGEFCLGHLKRWYYDEPHRLSSTAAELETIKELGSGAEIYRCERCQTLYRAAPADLSTAGQKYEPRTVNLLGGFSGKR